MGTSFAEKFFADVFDIVRQIPPGCVATYGLVARLMCRPCHARMVGRAMAAAPEDVPCHRVVNAGGRTAPGWREQRSLLEAEGVRFRPNGCVDLGRNLWRIGEPE